MMDLHKCLPIYASSVAAVLACLTSPTAGSAQLVQSLEEQEAEIVALDENVALARRYVEHYLSQQYAEMVEMMADTVRVEDPAWPFEIQGRDAVSEWLPKAYGAMEFHGFQPIMAYGSLNGLVVVISQVQSSWSLPGEAPTEFDVPMTIVLRLAGGEVVLHQDFPGYGCTARQGLAQQEGRDMSALMRCGQIGRQAEGRD
jgi:hypothetical protein